MKKGSEHTIFGKIKMTQTYKLMLSFTHKKNKCTLKLHWDVIFHLSDCQKFKKSDYTQCWQGYKENKYSHIYITATTSMKGNLTKST